MVADSFLHSTADSQQPQAAAFYRSCIAGQAGQVAPGSSLLA